MTAEEKAIYFYSKDDFIYCMQILKDKASKTTIFPLLGKMPFNDTIKLKNEIENSLSCYNFVLQEHRASGLSTVLSLFLAYNLYFNDKEDERNIFIITDHKHIIDNTKEFLKYFQIIYGNEEVKITSSDNKVNNTFYNFYSKKLNIYFARENAYTIQNLTNLNKESKLEIFYDNGKISNTKKLESILDVFYNDNFSCNIFYPAMNKQINIKYEPNIIYYKNQTIKQL